MQQLNVLTDDADQKVTVQLTDGTILQLEFIYRAGIQRWTMNLLHNLLQLDGYTLACGPNILRQWRNLVPFGILLLSVDRLDPIQPTDFQAGRVAVFILNASEVAAVETDILAPIPLVNP